MIQPQYIDWKMVLENGNAWYSKTYTHRMMNRSVHNCGGVTLFGLWDFTSHGR